MKTILKLAIGVAATPAALLGAASAQAQIAGIATVNSTVAIAQTKAFNSANQQIQTTYKSSMDQVDAKQKTRQGLLAQLDANKDNQIDDAELQKAQTAKSPALTQIQAVDREIETLTEPALKSQAYALEMISLKYSDALKKVVADKKIQMILTPESFIYAPDAVDVTQAITAELDRTVPTVSTTAPAGWKPNRQTLGLLQQIQQLSAAAAQARAAQARAGQPATPQPQGR